jgi:holliday junction DNA helicase RuvA
VIARLRGKPVAHDAEGLVLDVAGVGYRVHATPTAIRKADGADETVVETHLHVREDALQLYGFADVAERELFEQLLAVSGVGPKVALAIVGSRATADLQLAILQQDQAVLVSIPGIGKKLAERIIFELKEKVSAAGVAAGSSTAVASASEGEVVAALQALGYSLGEAREASRLALNDATVGAGLEERVKAALRTLLRD